MNADGDGYLRVTVDCIAKSVYFTRGVEFTDSGHLKFTDHDGRDHVFSDSHTWKVTEADYVPKEVCGDE